ncbi:hypothetical protein C5167_038268 [Papaver somniferum]|uniref:carnosine N-methyltransferase n=1 Tax=Papaver somniferum TaxID=3469 RepID=A0A4Y7I8Q6_PAPSO|nr:hypothetical protein C5167_038268 [Papaver somniferum]
MSSGAGEHRLHSKLEEALEIKSLRRIISAYLNYSDAAEEDVKRYERSYKQLPPAHKAILSHIPFKFQRLRRSISVNSFFIMSMLQAFEPPLDMSQDIDIREKEDRDDVCNDHLSGERNFSYGLIPTTSGKTPETDQLYCGEGINMRCKSPENRTSDEGVPVVSKSVSMENTTGLNNAGRNDAMDINCEAGLCSVSDSNGNVCSVQQDWLDPSLQLQVPLADVDKVRCIIRNIVRDWAPEGQWERDQCYKPILEELDHLFPSRSKDRPPCCLVPGAGLGRLALEISCLGFISQGNEFSYYMMICSNFILNQTVFQTHATELSCFYSTEAVGEWTIYPWIHSNCNSLSDNDQLCPVSFPDIHPASVGITEGFSMCGGDFVEVYSDPSQEGAWDTIVTCFFIDTAHNIVEYIETISRLLVDGGAWINLGPLLYHFADAFGTEDEMSIELSLEDVKKVAFQYGFQLEREKFIETTYTANPRSMMQNRYSAAFWTMTKIQKPSKDSPQPT